MGNAARVAEELDAAFDGGAAIVVAGMTGTRFCDTSGIHVLVMAPQAGPRNRSASAHRRRGLG